MSTRTALMRRPSSSTNPTSGTAPIERYIRRLVTYLARLQSVTQNSEKGLNLRVYVKLDTKQWLHMYSRIYHACELTTCMHLPDPIMLTAAAMIKSNDDLAVDPDPERSNIAMKAIRSLQTEMGLGGRPDAAVARAQTVILATDFDLCAHNRLTRSHITLGQTLRDKGWSELSHISPCFGNSYTCRDTQDMLSSVGVAIREMNEIQRSTLTPHIHLLMQAIVMDNITWPFSDVGTGADVRAEAQRKLKATYVDPILEVARMTTRAPIVNINHDPRFIAIAKYQRSVRSQPCHSVSRNGHLRCFGTTSTRMRGHSWIFILVPRWQCRLKTVRQLLTRCQMLSWEAGGNGDERNKLVHRG